MYYEQTYKGREINRIRSEGITMKDEPSGADVTGTGKENKDEKGQEIEKLFDLVIPPGTPQSVISDVTKKFEVEVVERKGKADFCQHGRG